MKKTIMILSMAIMLLSCTPGDDNSSQNNLDCSCGEVIQSASFNVVNGQGGVDTFSVVKIKNNCTQEITQTQRNGNIAVGTQICNY